MIIGGDGKFLKSFNIVGRGVLTPYFRKSPLILATPPPLFKFCPTRIMLIEIVEMNKTHTQTHTLAKHLEKDNTGKGEL